MANPLVTRSDQYRLAGNNTSSDHFIPLIIRESYTLDSVGIPRVQVVGPVHMSSDVDAFFDLPFLPPPQSLYLS